MNAQVRPVQSELLALFAIVSNNRDLARDANQKLVAFTVRMLTACFSTGNIKHQEIAQYFERDLLADLAYAKRAAQVDRQG